MKNGTDEVVDRVLHAMRDVDVPAGMEERVLARLESVAPRLHGWSLPLKLAVAGGVLFSLVLAGVVVHRISLRHDVAEVSSVRHSSNDVVTIKESGRALRDTPTPPFVAKSATKNGAPIRGAQLARQVLRNEDVAVRKNVAQEASVGPIVEPPVTYQEELLRRAVDLHNPEVIAALQPHERAVIPVVPEIELDENSTLIIRDIP